MSGMMVEKYMLQVLNNGISSIQQDPSLLVDILDALGAEELQSAQNYFGNPKTKIGIAPGFPNQQTKFPFIGVTVANSDQDLTRTPIRMNMGRTTDNTGNIVPVVGAQFDGQFRATIYTPNPDEILYLTEIVFWAMFTQMQSFVDAGMNRIRFSVGDYEPSPEFLPMFVFARSVFLSASHTRTYSTAPLPIIKSASIAVNEEAT